MGERTTRGDEAEGYPGENEDEGRRKREGRPRAGLGGVTQRGKAGDTVRIFYSSTPYKGKFLLAAQGTTDAPVRICGVRGPNGERPEIDGESDERRARAGARTLMGLIHEREGESSAGAGDQGFLRISSGVEQ